MISLAFLFFFFVLFFQAWIYYLLINTINLLSKTLKISFTIIIHTLWWRHQKKRSYSIHSLLIMTSQRILISFPSTRILFFYHTVIVIILPIVLPLLKTQVLRLFAIGKFM